MQRPVIVTLTRFPDIFARFRASCDKYEPDAIKVVVTSGGAEIEASGWRVRQGVEPFVFARNANIGMAGFEDRDVLLVNDDCEFVMPLTAELKEAADASQAGILSPTIDGDVGNRLQRYNPRRTELIEWSKERLAFVCVWLPSFTRATVGRMDERFTGYGGDDRSYCQQAQRAGLLLGIVRSLVIRHGFPPHTYSSSYLRLMSHEERDRQMAAMDRLVEEDPAALRARGEG